MLATITLTNTQAAILYILAFVGLWHIIGIPPVAEWGKRGALRRLKRLDREMSEAVKKFQSADRPKKEYRKFP